MKKFLYNLLFLLLILAFFEGIACLMYYNKTKEILEIKNNAGLIQKFRYTKAHNFTTEYFSHLFTKHISENSKKRPIVILGCSYVEGTGLKEEQTLAYKLFETTHRSVYKRGIPGGGIQLALHQFETGEMQKDVPDAEYVIYVYLDYHLARLYAYELDYLETEVNQRYKIRNGELIKIKQPKYPFYYSSFFVKKVQEKAEEISSFKEYGDYHLFNAVMKKLKEETSKNYKNSKFVILLYPSGDCMNTNNEIMPQEEISKLKEMGFTVINAEDLSTLPIRNEEYRIADKDHPNEKAWDAIVDNLIKTLKL